MIKKILSKFAKDEPEVDYEDLAKQVEEANKKYAEAMIGNMKSDISTEQYKAICELVTEIYIEQDENKIVEISERVADILREDVDGQTFEELIPKLNNEQMKKFTVALIEVSGGSIH